MSVVPRRGAFAQPRSPSRFDQRLARILDQATEIFCEKGYERASMRDLSRACGMSLAGLYYYFDSKERMLYLIQKELFQQVMEQLDQKLNRTIDPEQRVRIFIENHIVYFLSRKNAMKVLAHEDDALSGKMRAEIQAIKREYYIGSLALLEELKLRNKLQFQSRVAAMSLFGMMNWLHTWYNPNVDGTPAILAKEVAEIFLRGVYRNNGARLH